jgi:hypothetical protein
MPASTRGANSRRAFGFDALSCIDGAWLMSSGAPSSLFLKVTGTMAQIVADQATSG